MDRLPIAATPTLGLAVALGCGLLIGVERERRKGRGPRREAAGLRGFAVVAALGGIALRPVALLVVLILVLQAVAHVALRVLGARGGLLLVGFLSGFVSSTATVATMGRRARAEPAQARACAGGAAMSGAATWVLATLVVGAIVPAAVGWVAASAAAGAAVAAGVAWWPMRRRGRGTGGAGGDRVAAHTAEKGLQAPKPAPAHPPRADGPLRPREAFVLAGLLIGVSAAVAVLARWLGPQAALPGAALAALADAHAAIAALASLVEAGTLPAPMLRWGLLVAVATNTVMRIAVAAVTGGGAFARRVAPALLASWAAALAVAAMSAPAH